MLSSMVRIYVQEKGMRENLVAYNIIPLDAPAATNAITSFLEVFVATWNVAGKSPTSSLNLEDWLHTSPPTDIYVLGNFIAAPFASPSRKASSRVSTADANKLAPMKLHINCTNQQWNMRISILQDSHKNSLYVVLKKQCNFSKLKGSQVKLPLCCSSSPPLPYKIVPSTPVDTLSPILLAINEDEDALAMPSPNPDNTVRPIHHCLRLTGNNIFSSSGVCSWNLHCNSRHKKFVLGWWKEASSLSIKRTMAIFQNCLLATGAEPKFLQMVLFLVIVCINTPFSLPTILTSSVLISPSL
ncbi:hypothetical protein L1887_21031 [Cichorium endivia]|nr:hypothetical protein L1887_21031 [Cichorium endivia]